MLYATGQTFQHKETLKSLGGQWDNAGKRWSFPYASSGTADELKKLLGVLVTGDTESFGGDDDLGEDLEETIQRITSRRPTDRVGRTAVYGDDPRYLSYFRDQNPTAFFGFSSLYQLTKHVESLEGQKLDGTRRRGWATGQSEHEWFGTPHMAAALKLAKDGWLEGLDGLTELDIPHAEAKRRVPSVAGGRVSVGRLLSGDPKHMIRRPKSPGRRVVTLFVETYMTAGVDPDMAILRARLVAAIADALERQGYSCEILAILTTAGNDGRTGHQASVVVKSAGESLNLLDAVFALGHPSFFRRLLFAVVGGAEECGTTWSGQGSPTTAFDADHPTKKNEFYVRQLNAGDQRRVDKDSPLSMLPLIKPYGLPI